MIPERAVLPQPELVVKRLSRLDRRKGDERHPVHAIRQQHAMPVDGGVRLQCVGHVDACQIAFPERQRGGWNAAIHRHSGARPAGEVHLLFANREMVLHHLGRGRRPCERGEKAPTDQQNANGEHGGFRGRQMISQFWKERAPWLPPLPTSEPAQEGTTSGPFAVPWCPGRVCDGRLRCHPKTATTGFAELYYGVYSLWKCLQSLPSCQLRCAPCSRVGQARPWSRASSWWRC